MSDFKEGDRVRLRVPAQCTYVVPRLPALAAGGLDDGIAPRLEAGVELEVCEIVGWLGGIVFNDDFVAVVEVNGGKAPKDVLWAPRSYLEVFP